MNICMFTNTYRPHVGGVARSVSFFEEDLRRMGHQVLIIAPTFVDNEVEIEEAGNVLRVPAIQNFNGSDFSVRIPLPFLINERIDEFKPDIIHSHHPFLLGDSAMRTAHRRHLPLIFTHHTLYEAYTHYVPLDSPAMKRFVIRLSTLYANMCTQVIAPSRSIADLIRSRGVKTPVTELPTGIDVGFLRKGEGKRFRKEHAIADDAFVVGHVGRLALEKNLDYLAQAVTTFLADAPESLFVVIGDGKNGENIRKIFTDAGLENQLILAGKKTGMDLADAYAAMDLFVFSSKSETQGLVVAEAMAARTPVIALDAPGVREVVADRENGRLLSSEATVASFADALSEAKRDPDMMAAWRQGAGKTADLFDRTVCAGRLLELYENVRDRGHEWHRHGKTPFGVWDDLLNLLSSEWSVLSKTVSAIAHAIQDPDNSEEESEPVPDV